MRTFSLYLPSLLALTVAAGCSKSQEPAPPAATTDTPVTSTPVPSTPSTPAPEASATPPSAERAASDVAAFSAKLLQEVQKQAGNTNLALSPWSVESALLIAAGGAEGTTRDEMLKALGFGDQDAATVHRNVGALAEHLRQAALEVDDDGTVDPDDSVLHTANALWIESSLRGQLKPAYAQFVQETYHSAVHDAPFSTATEQARKAINDWVEDNTDDKIKDLIAPGILTAATSLVITNAVHFDADWQTEFKKDQTRNAPFTLVDGTSVSAATMHHTFDQLHVWEHDQLVGVRLPYEGDGYAMDIVLPAAGQFEAVRDRLYSQGFDAVFNGEAQRERVKLALPKFKFETSAQLNQALIALGMAEAFTGSANFSGMFTDVRQMISAVIHKVYIDVDEEGTEAAAATGVVMMRSSAMRPSEPREIKVDRPFLFAIRDVQNGTPVFIGQVMNPTLR